MELSERKKTILKAIIEEYIQNAEPVGSKCLTSCWQSPLSSATIRNEMSDLEALGLLEKPHTSAGRVPSQNGYRFYVDELMNSYRLTVEEINALNDMMKSSLSRLERIAEQSSKILSYITDHPVLSISEKKKQISAKRFEFIPIGEKTCVLMVILDDDTVKSRLINLTEEVDGGKAEIISKAFNAFFADVPLDNLAEDKLELIVQMSGNQKMLAKGMADFLRQLASESLSDELYLEGVSKFLSYPEFHNPDRAREILDFLSDAENIKNIHFNEELNGVGVAIGKENANEALRDASVIYKVVNLPDGTHFVLAVMGPTRMDYSKTAAKLNAFAERVKHLLPGTE